MMTAPLTPTASTTSSVLQFDGSVWSPTSPLLVLRVVTQRDTGPGDRRWFGVSCRWPSQCDDHGGHDVVGDSQEVARQVVVVDRDRAGGQTQGMGGDPDFAYSGDSVWGRTS